MQKARLTKHSEQLCVINFPDGQTLSAAFQVVATCRTIDETTFANLREITARKGFLKV